MSATAERQNVAAKNLIATDTQDGQVGLIAWWRLSGAASYDELAMEWALEGLDQEELPTPPGPAAALTRALNEQKSKRQLVRPLEGDRGKALVIETAHGEELLYDVELSARVDEVGHLTILPEGHHLAAAIRHDYQRHIDELSPSDIGGWLVRQVERCDGIRLRDTGGIYYVPPSQVERWGKITRAIHTASGHRINGVPAMRTADAVASILDALNEEAGEAAAEIEKELEGELTPKKASNRVIRVEALEAKVGRYEQLLGAKTEKLRERLETLRALLAARALLSMPVLSEGAAT